MKRKKLPVFLFSFLLVIFTAPSGWSGSDLAPQKEESHKWLREIGLLSGYGTAPLDDTSAEYEVIPILTQFGFDINPLARKMKIKPRGTFELVVEPLFNVVINPGTNAEVGCSFLVKYTDNITSRIAPYLEFGLGMVYTTQKTREQGTQYNFLTNLGLGLQVFLNKDFALTAGYRYRHMSNAGISDSNRGIDHHFGLVGVSYFFK